MEIEIPIWIDNYETIQDGNSPKLSIQPKLRYKKKVRV